MSPATVLLSPLLGGSITISAAGGPVNWSVSESGSLVGKLTIAPSSGTLASGQSTSVSVSASGLASLDSQITVNPGGHQVTVLVGVNLGAESVGRLTVNPGGHVITVVLVTRATPSPSPSPSQSPCPSPSQSAPSAAHPDGGGGCCGGSGDGCGGGNATAGAGPGSFPPQHEGRLVD